jgi:hypothetical protein
MHQSAVVGWYGSDKGRRIKNSEVSWEPVAHACNLSYSGGRDQEDQGSKPVWA